MGKTTRQLTVDVRELYQTYCNRLETLYPRQEAESLTIWLLDYFLHIRRAEILHGREVSVSDELERAMSQLLENKPIQYITQSAPFYGRDFKVGPAVLIPRNETEELVHLIIGENKEGGMRVMDIGTGSGCIAITLALEMHFPDVYAMDISMPALNLAEENARLLGAEVGFFQGDILGEEIPVSNLDILVSNPPYIRESEKLVMHRNVLDHEPHLALFVPDKDPLTFYKAILKKGKVALKPHGRLYVEINEVLGSETALLAANCGYREIKLIQNLNGKNRMLSAVNG